MLSNAQPLPRIAWLTMSATKPLGKSQGCGWLLQSLICTRALWLQKQDVQPPCARAPPMVQDSIVLGKLGDDSIVTMGADRPSINYEAVWKRELGVSKVDTSGTATGALSAVCRHSRLLAQVTMG